MTIILLDRNFTVNGGEIYRHSEVDADCAYVEILLFGEPMDCSKRAKESMNITNLNNYEFLFIWLTTKYVAFL
ncbi:MAG: hypothetical protein ACK6BZ_09260 [Candidatus Kapaibacterium sp.]